MSRQPESRPIAVANPASGSADGDGSGIGEWCARLDIELRDPGDDLEGAITAAAGEHPPYVAVVGGDGTLRTAAPILALHGVPMLPVPGGTFNHFAKANGIADLDDAARAAVAGQARDVPYAEINGQAFLNTCVIGWYPEMVRTRERLRQRLPRPVAAAAATILHLARLRRFHVDVDGRERAAWLLWAGNGNFGTGPTDIAQRTEIDGSLDVRIALADSSFARTRLLTDLVRGRLRDSDQLERVVVHGPLTVGVKLRRVNAALDAEVIELTTPVTFTPAAQTVRVLTAPVQ